MSRPGIEIAVEPRWQISYGMEDFLGCLSLALRDVLVLGRDKGAVGMEVLSRAFGLDDLAGLLNLADEAVAGENNASCGMATRPMGRCPMGGEPGML